MPQRVVVVRALFGDGRYLGLVVTRKLDYLVDDFVDSVLRKAEAAGLSPIGFRDHSVNREKIS
jgi:hypothetical protein